MKLKIVLPIYNEAPNLEALLTKIAETCTQASIAYQVFAVDDGSTDDSAVRLASLAQQYPVTVLTHKRNRGLGESIRDGFEAAADSSGPNDVIVRMDADCTHEPKYIPALLDAIKAGADVAIASRFPEGGGQEGLTSDRLWLSRVANIAFRICFPLGGIREYTCGYRAYRAVFIQRALIFYGGRFIQLRGLGFCCTVEKLLKLKLLGAKLVEVPFVLRYDLKLGDSKMVFNITTLGYALMVILFHWPRGGWKSSARLRAKQEPAWARRAN